MICGVVCGCICNVGRSDPDTTLVDHLCNREKYNSSSSYTYDVADVTNKLITFMGNNSYDYYHQHSSGDSTCYGHAACNGRITNGDCFYCLQSACETIKDITQGVRRSTRAVRIAEERLRQLTNMVPPAVLQGIPRQETEPKGPALARTAKGLREGIVKGRSLLQMLLTLTQFSRLTIKNEIVAL
ncbi:hypothetical protein NL676_014008 [Syzygium grande]|nr:hypothetical protein NL676_014008 [Syzygium grande]